MDKSTAALLEIAAALDIEVGSNVDIKSLKLKILAGIDRLDSQSQCREKDWIKTLRKASQWRVKAQRYQSKVTHLVD